MSGALSQSASMPMPSRSRRSVDLLSTLLDASERLQYLRGSSNGLCTDNTRSPVRTDGVEAQDAQHSSHALSP